MDAPSSRSVGSRGRGDGHYHSVILKLELLSQGLGISPAASEEIGKSLKVDHAVGAVGKHALDIILKPGKVYVGLPHGASVNDHFEKDTPFLLDVDGEGQYFIAKETGAADGRRSLGVHRRQRARQTHHGLYPSFDTGLLRENDVAGTSDAQHHAVRRRFRRRNHLSTVRLFWSLLQGICRNRMPVLRHR